jgi:hypothetical protein
MTRQIFAFALCCALAMPAQEPTPSVIEQVTKIPASALVEVRTTQKVKIRGRLGETSGAGLTLSTIENGRMTETFLAYSEVKSIKAVRARDSSGATVAKTTGWVVIGALAGLGAFILIAAAVFSGD